MGLKRGLESAAAGARTDPVVLEEGVVATEAADGGSETVPPLEVDSSGI